MVLAIGFHRARCNRLVVLERSNRRASSPTPCPDGASTRAVGRQSGGFLGVTTSQVPRRRQGS